MVGGKPRRGGGGVKGRRGRGLGWSREIGVGLILGRRIGGYLTWG